MNTIAYYWEKFVKLFFQDVSANKYQYKAMQMCFYFGANAMQKLYSKTGEADVSEEAAIALMKAWENEFDEFVEQFKKEKFSEQLKKDKD